MSNRILISSCSLALSCISFNLQAEEPPVTAAPAVENPSQDPVAQTSNQQILENWQQTTGQQAAIVDDGAGIKLEFHGQATTELYNVNTSFDESNGALSGLREGTFTNTRLQGDLRTLEPAGDVSYIQGSASFTRDRARQTLYSSQINNLQFGRAGAGYQLSAGDVVADFSKIGSNIGLRGVYGAKQVNALTIYGYAGTVADTWEALFNRSTVNNQPARNRFLRDVAGFKADYKVNEQWSIFGTAQTYTDRKSTLIDALQAGQIAQNGSTGTTGIKYNTAQASFSAEVGASRNGFDTLGGDTFGDAALLLDAAYAWQTLSMTVGHHNLGARYTALSSNVVPGIRESFVNTNWVITPNLTFINDVRRSDNRTANLFNDDIVINKIYGVVNGFNYSTTQIPGLNFSLQDRRNWSETDDIKTRNAATDFATSYANQHYNANLTLSNSRQRSNNNPESNSVSDSAQIVLGRQILMGELLVLPTISAGVSVNFGYSQQRIANGTETSSASQGINCNAQSQTLGQLSFGIINIDTRQPNGRPLLNSKAINLDWNKNVSEALVMKAYVRNNYRNHGDDIQQVDEKIVGLEADYQW